MLNKRSITIIRRVLRAAMEDALDEALIRRNPAARVPVPKKVVKPERPREVDAWDESQVPTCSTRSGSPVGGTDPAVDVLRVATQRALGLKWDDIDPDAATVRIDEALIEVEGRPVWTEGKNERSRRTFGVDPDTAARLAAHRRLQLEERMLAGSAWTTRTWCSPPIRGTGCHPATSTRRSNGW